MSRRRPSPVVWKVPVESVPIAIETERTPPHRLAPGYGRDVEQAWRGNVEERLERLELDPISLVERRIVAATTPAELDMLNEKLEALGVRMVERAAELRAMLRKDSA